MSRGAAGVVVAALLAAATACAPSTRESATTGSAPATATATPATETPADPWFVNVLAGSGIDFVHQTGATGQYWFPEIAAGGAGLLDFDGDGLLDVYLIQAGSLDDPVQPPGNRLYRNRGDWTFEDVTSSAGVGDTRYGMGCAAGDYDADGDVDLYVTNVGSSILYRNDGNGRFTDVTARAGVDNPSWGASAAFLDEDLDGLLDLFVVNYIDWSRETEITCLGPDGKRDYCAPKNYRAPTRSIFFRGEAGGRFSDRSAAVGIDKASGHGFGIVLGDFDGEGGLDVFVANDGVPNQLWLHRQGGWADRAMLSGVAVDQRGWAEAGMGIAAGDVDEDGDLDLFMTTLSNETSTLFVNRSGQFTETTDSAGIEAPGADMTGWGTALVDLDDDGILDVYIANGRVKKGSWLHDPQDPYAEPSQVFRGLGGGRFEEILPRGGTAAPLIASSRAAAFGDLDNDGDVDVLVANRDARPYLLRNDAGGRGDSVLLRVLDRNGVDAVGARLRVAVEGRILHRIVQVAYSYCATNDPRVHVGLGTAARIDSIDVRWPDGGEERFGPFEAGGIFVVRRGDPSGATGPR